MPVSQEKNSGGGKNSRSKKIPQLLLCGLLPIFSVQADQVNSISAPSMAFLEYLGDVENEIDGQLSSPLELDLEAAQLANKQHTDTTNISSEEHGDE